MTQGKTRSHFMGRRLERWSAWQSQRLEALTGMVTRRLDALNRALAKQAVPPARRERVEALLRERGQRRPPLEIIRSEDRNRTEDS